MNTEIHPIRLGIAQSFVIRHKGTILVDAGGPGQASRFQLALKRLQIDPQNIALIVLTHGHPDHVGSAREIQELTGAKIALHHREQEWLEKPIVSVPRGVTVWGRILTTLIKLLLPFVKFPPAHVDIPLDDKGSSLEEYGIPGRILYTPGHTRGSMSVLLDSGDAIVGDLAMNGFPLRRGPGLPIFAEDLQRVRESWQLLLHAGAKTIYPAHGRPFSADVMRSVAL